MAIEIVDFPIKNGGSFHSYVKLPEGTHEIPTSRNTAEMCQVKADWAKPETFLGKEVT